LPVKRGPTVKKIALWLFSGRGQNGAVAKWFKNTTFKLKRGIFFETYEKRTSVLS
jgi:hypothetical protein